nr:LacI family DNA-binding transcriptional regulator [Pediococcus damnosus]
MARLAGVSKSTVSRVLNGDDTLSVSQSTEKNIFEAAGQLSYDKYKTKHKTNGTIAVVLSYKESEELDDVYFMSLRLAVNNHLTDSNYRFKNFFQTDYERNELAKQSYIGIVAVGFFDKETILKLRALHKPIVFVNTDTLLDNVDCVVTDFTSSVARTTNHLLQAGIKDIGILTAKQHHHHLITLENDPQGFLAKTFLQCKKTFNPDYFFVAEDYTAAAGYQEMNKIIDKLGAKLPKAFLIGSDSIAIGAMRALTEHKIAIPQQISVIGFNDITSAQYITPSLSTVHVSRNAMARAAFELLNEQFQKRNMVPRKITIGTSLIIRDSSV